MKVRMRFSKSGTMKFIGHLDVMRYFQKAFRRAGLDMLYSQGYSPHPLLSFAQPLGIGLTSDGEYLDLQLASSGASAEMIARINEVMTPEMQIESFVRLPDESKTSMALVAAADYRIARKDWYETENIEGLSEQLASFLSRQEIRVVKKTKKGESELDLRPFLYQAAVTAEEGGSWQGQTWVSRPSRAEEYENGQVLYLRLAAGSEINIKPELVMETFLQTLGQSYQPFAWQIHRLELYARKKEEEFIALEQLGEELL